MTILPFGCYVAGRVKNSGDIGRMRSNSTAVLVDMSEREHQQFPRRTKRRLARASHAAFGKSILAKATAASDIRG